MKGASGSTDGRHKGGEGWRTLLNDNHLQYSMYCFYKSTYHLYHQHHNRLTIILYHLEVVILCNWTAWYYHLILRYTLPCSLCQWLLLCLGKLHMKKRDA